MVRLQPAKEGKAMTKYVKKLVKKIITHESARRMLEKEYDKCIREDAERREEWLLYRFSGWEKEVPKIEKQIEDSIWDFELNY